MIDFVKKYKFVFLAAIVVIAALVFAFIGGGKSEPPANQSAPTTSAISKIPMTTAEPQPTQATTTAATAASSAQPTTVPASSKPVASVALPSQTATQPPAEVSSAPVTNPAPTSKPQPTEPQTKPAAHHCTLSVSCETALSRRDTLSEDVAAVIPDDGIILKPVTMTYREGQSVFDILQEACRANGVHLEFTDTPIYRSAYIEGIGNLYEFDCGAGSGWMYRVNGWFPNYGCSRYTVQDGDVIEWLYTCDLGNDIGGRNDYHESD